MHTIYCFINGGVPGLLNVVALADDGHCLAGHGSSNESWARHDIGIHSTWKHDKYDAHFGAGNWTLEWVDGTKNHEGVEKAVALNAALPQEAETPAT